ncbi:MAG: (d)CMP kinase [Lachnospiraceae bacterium]|nr:(d)CMP kinase [Lachnospiraceae bacterium]
MSFNIAIDGPAGAGKSTIAKRIAKELGFIYVDTGAMYRAMALFMLREGIDPHNSDHISKACTHAKISIEYQNGEQVVLLNDENVNGLIRTQQVGQMASLTSANPSVRSAMLDLQRNLAATSDVVMDGRDIGTVILPNADIKIFLTASSETRAKRRYEELAQKGEACDLDTIEKEIIQRDYQDMHREIAPLRQAEDAIYVDSSNDTVEEVVQRIIKIVRKKGA